MHAPSLLPIESLMERGRVESLMPQPPFDWLGPVCVDTGCSWLLRYLSILDAGPGSSLLILLIACIMPHAWTYKADVLFDLIAGSTIEFTQSLQMLNANYKGFNPYAPV